MGADGNNLCGLVNISIIIQIKAQSRVEALHMRMAKLLGHNWWSC